MLEGVALDARLARAAGLGTAQGLLITRVIPGGNAERAGLRDGSAGRQVRYGAHGIPVEGDILVAFDGQKVVGIAELFALLESTRPNDVVTLTILRNGALENRQLVLSERPD